MDGSALRGIIGISGLYDLRPFRYTELQTHLQFTGDQIQRNSPLFRLRSSMPPTWLLVGAEETPEFHRQADSFAEAMRDCGNSVERLSIDSSNHFSVMEGFDDERSRLFKLIKELAEGGRGH